MRKTPTNNEAVDYYSTRHLKVRLKEKLKAVANRNGRSMEWVLNQSLEYGLSILEHELELLDEQLRRRDERERK